MLPECSTESFQCDSRYLGHRAVCGDLPAAGQGGRSDNKERCNLVLHCQHQADVTPPGIDMIDARERFPKQNQGPGIAEAIRVRLLDQRTIFCLSTPRWPATSTAP